MKAKFVNEILNEAFERKNKDVARKELLYPELSNIKDYDSLMSALKKIPIEVIPTETWIKLAQYDLALRLASYNGHVEVVKLLLAAGADVHADNDHVLRWASDNGRVEVVKLLLAVGADVHAEDDFALRRASRYGHVEVVKLLLAAGADVHAKDDYALRWASKYGQVEVVKLLLAAGADKNKKNSES